MDVRNSLENRIQKILYSVFQFGPKTKPNTKSNVTYIACPYCGDSDKDKSKKRFTIYWESSSCYCYNCETYKKVDRFLSDFKESNLSFEESQWIHTNSYKKVFNRGRSDTLFRNHEDFQDLLKYSITVKDFCRVGGYEIASRNNSYLNSRYLGRFHKEFLELSYKVGDYKDNVVILNKITDNRIIGITIRDNRPNIKNKYFVYTLDKIYAKFFPNRYAKLKADGVDLEKFNLISYYYNFFNLNFDKPITVFEGPIDRMFYPNSVAISSLWRDYTFFKNLDNVRFMFDDDKVAKKHNIKLLKDKKTIFLWSKFKTNKKIKSKSVKDMNDLIILSQKDKIPYFKDTPDFFSNDPLDIIKI